jgi:peptidoglycan/xylan/chitin deacetylase (PgdA/CDA1 family)
MRPAVFLLLACCLGACCLGACCLGACCGSPGVAPQRVTLVEGGIIRGDTTRAALALVFTGDQYADGGASIRETLSRYGVPGSFFFTGHFYRNPNFDGLIAGLKADGHYLGAHSDRHLLYCSWENRDSLLVTHEAFVADLEANYREMERFGIAREEASYFMPPYEWYNAQISAWTAEQGLTLVNFTPGTRSNADYTTPEMGARYVPSDRILQSILAQEQQDPHGLNGFILLVHIGTAPERTDKFYAHLGTLITTLQERGYRFERIDGLLKP